MVDTLKTIGLGVGFGALVKESLQINKSLTSLDMRMKSIFGSEFDSSAISAFSSELNISNIAAKTLLSTIGQFAKGLGQSKEYTKAFSTDLMQAAVNYGTFIGKTSTEDFNDIARKFAKATLGEVGELKEIGIVVDATSESFKKYVKDIQDATGASEAQARQQAITNKILDQVNYTSGLASENMYDGWTQLNILFDNFKEILAEVGGIFSDIFSPIISTLNAVIQIPFVKNVTAWGIALGSIVVGYVSLVKIMREVTSLTKSQTEMLKMMPEELEKIRAISRRILNSNAAFDAWDYKSRTGAFPNAPIVEKITQKEWYMSQTPEQNMHNITIGMEKIAYELKGMFPAFSKTYLASQGINSTVIGILEKFNIFNGVLKESKAVTIGAAAAEKLLALERSLLGVKTLGLAGALQKLKKSFIEIGVAIGVFFKTLGGGALLKGLGVFSAILLKIALVVGAAAGAFIILFDSIKGLINLINGKSFYEGTISNWIAEFLSGFKEAEKASKSLDQLRVKMVSYSNAIKSMDEELKNISLEKTLKEVLPSSAIEILEERAKKLKNEIKILSNQTVKSYEEFKKSRTSSTDEDAVKKMDEAFKTYEETRKKYIQSMKDLQSVENQIVEKRKEIINLNKTYSKELLNLAKQFDQVRESFNFDYKNGIFGNWTDDIKYENISKDIDRVSQSLSKLSGKDDLDSLNSAKELNEELFNLTREKAKYELDALWKQREAAIENLKAMGDLLHSVTGYKSTLQQGIEAGSFEALEIQSRRFNKASKSELSPIIEQQKQIKDIEAEMLTKQSTSESTLKNIYIKLNDITKKIGTQSGATNIEIVAPI